MVTHGIFDPYSLRSGKSPHYLLGRSQAIATIKSNLADPVGDEHGNLLFTGIRGIGKTVMLTEASKLAAQVGWLVLDSYLTDEGLMTRLHRGLNRFAGGKKTKRTGGGFTAFAANANTSVETESPDLNFSDRVQAILEEKHAPGILITVDEVHSTAGRAQAELREYGNEIQLLHRRNLPVMSIMAGLPGGIDALLKDEDEQRNRTGATFLRRAVRYPLSSIDLDEIWAAYSDAAKKSGKLVGPKVLDMMAEATQGYPYLFQLIGQRVWLSSSTIIDEEMATAGIESAIRRLGSAVLDPSLEDLSDLDRSFLLAMAKDDKRSKMQDIATRMHISSQQATNYKRRLVKAEMVVDDYGYANFTMPYMRERLREHYASTI